MISLLHQALAVGLSLPLVLSTDPGGHALQLEHISTVQLGPVGTGAAEIVAYDPPTQQAFVTNAHTSSVDVYLMEDPSQPRFVRSLDLRSFGGGVNSVAVHGDLVAVAVEGFFKQDPGRVLLYSTSGELLSLVEVGALPDMLIFSPDGKWLLVANEGEPSDDYRIDPEGSVTVVEVPADPRRLGQRHCRTAHFQDLITADLDPSIRIFGPGSTVAEDLEPEYIAISPDSLTAYVVCQENNAIAVIDILSATVTNLLPLGFKNHSLAGHGIDASDRDNWIHIAQWPVLGMYQPDTIKIYESAGATYLVMADEGDPRNYTGFSEVARVSDLRLDAEAFPNAADLQKDQSLGRLEVSSFMGDPDGDGVYEELYSFGGRGFSIRDLDGVIQFESGDDFEQVTAREVPDLFNSDNESNDTVDRRSSKRGPEPEALQIGQVGERMYAFVGLERTGGVVVYDITVPRESGFVGYWTTRRAEGNVAQGTAGDIGPEGFAFVPAVDSPTGVALLLIANEVSGTLRTWEVQHRE
jgi:2',3'-cyclic-nucleotide 2'-phosphodiesterase / 3'-nucleotidase / 5'-nucleotidase